MVLKDVESWILKWYVLDVNVKLYNILGLILIEENRMKIIKLKVNCFNYSKR